MWWLAAAQMAYGIYSQGKQQRQELRAARKQQAEDNKETFRLIGEEQRPELRQASERRLMYGAAGLRGSSGTAAASDQDAGNQLRQRQEELARNIDTSLQDERTKDPIKDMASSYLEAVYGKPAKQVGDEAKRLGRRTNKEFNRFKKRLGF